MGRSIDWREGQSAAALEERVRKLEVRVTALTESLRVLTSALADLRAAEPPDSAAGTDPRGTSGHTDQC